MHTWHRQYPREGSNTGLAGSPAPIYALPAATHAFEPHRGQFLLIGWLGHVGNFADVGAKAFARADRVAFADASPSLHTVAHEGAHSLQQKAGISIASGVGSVGDAHERQADSVADAGGGAPNLREGQRARVPGPGGPRERDRGTYI